MTGSDLYVKIYFYKSLSELLSFRVIWKTYSRLKNYSIIYVTVYYIAIINFWHSPGFRWKTALAYLEAFLILSSLSLKLISYLFIRQGLVLKTFWVEKPEQFLLFTFCRMDCYYFFVILASNGYKDHC